MLNETVHLGFWRGGCPDEDLFFFPISKVNTAYLKLEIEYAFSLP